MVEKEISFLSVVESKSDSVMKLAKYSYELLFKFCVLVLSEYFNYSHPNLLGAVNRIAADLIETRPTWVATDFINICKFFRQRQDIEELKVYGQLTPEKFIAMVAIYEDHRAQEFEKSVEKKKGEFLQPGERGFSDGSYAAQIGKTLNEIQAKGVNRDYKIKSDEKYFEK